MIIKKKIRYEEAAEFRENIKGWVCKKCKRFWGNDSYSEHGARICCATDVKCADCDNRVTDKHRTLCESCMKKYDAKRYEERVANAETVEWDGEPFMINGELYSEIEDYLDACNDNEIEPSKFIFNSIRHEIIQGVGEFFDRIDEECGIEDYDSMYMLDGVKEFIRAYDEFREKNVNKLVYFEGFDEKVDISEYIAKFNEHN